MIGLFWMVLIGLAKLAKKVRLNAKLWKMLSVRFVYCIILGKVFLSFSKTKLRRRWNTLEKVPNSLGLG